MPKTFNCKNCGERTKDQVHFENKGPHVGVYCDTCGKWLAWISQKGLDELMREESDGAILEKALIDRVTSREVTPVQPTMNVSGRMLKLEVMKMLTSVAEECMLDIEQFRVSVDNGVVVASVYFYSNGVLKGVRQRVFVYDLINEGNQVLTVPLIEQLKNWDCL